MQVFTQQLEPWGDAEIDHDHFGGLGQIVADGCGCSGNVVLSETCAVVCDIDGERIGGRLFFPWSEVAADNLVCKCARAAELEFDGCGLGGFDVLEDELMKQIVVLRG